MVSNVVSLKDFARMVLDLGRSNRDVIIANGGMTGEGKSVWSVKLVQEFQSISKKKFSFDCMTWERKEFMRWINGDGESKEGQLPEYSPIIVDELIGMFYGRSWYDDLQKDSIKTLNTCRDRHLFITGSVPNFWEIDSSFRSRVRFYVFIPERGVAWVFQQENNPFSKDTWNVAENQKMFRKHKNPYKCPNFVCEIYYNDLTEDEAKTYQGIRNTKRMHINDDGKDRQERYGKIKEQRDILIRALMNANKKLTQKDVGELIDVSPELISLIHNGLR